MALSQSARVHLIYQFIILTLLFFGLTLGCYILLPVNQRSYMLYITIPMLMSYTAIFSCCLQIVPIPQWMNKSWSDQDGAQRTLMSDEACSLPSGNRRPAILSNPTVQFNGRAHSSQVPLLANNQEVTEIARSISIEPPFRSNAPAPICTARDSDGISNHPKTAVTNGTSINRAVQRSNTSIHPSCPSSNYRSIIPGPSNQPFVPPRDDIDEESELVRSYSYPIRQKRLEQWAETRKNLPPEKLPEKTNVPYWQTIGYILAVKKEARDRRRVASGPCSTRRSRLDGGTSDNRPEIKKLIGDRSPTGSTTGSKSKIRLGLSNLFSRSKDVDKEVKADVSAKSSKGFSLFGRKKKESKYYAVEEVPEHKSWLNKYGAGSSHRNFLDPDSEDDPFEPDTLEDHLSLFPDGMNRLSRKEPNTKK